MSVQKVVIALPAYNEEPNIRALFENLERGCALLAALGFNRTYIVVDDGSSDRTLTLFGEYARHLPITIVQHAENQGLGPTIRDALKAAVESCGKDDVIITMDADNTHPAGLMLSMTLRIVEGCDLVIASRFRPGARVVGLHWIRRSLSFGARVAMRMVFPIRGVRDYTSGYRAYRAGLLRAAFDEYGDSFVEEQGFQCMADILIRLRRFEPIISEVPMILRYDLKRGHSSMKVARTVANTLRLMARRRLAR